LGGCGGFGCGGRGSLVPGLGGGIRCGPDRAVPLTVLQYQPENSKSSFEHQREASTATSAIFWLCSFVIVYNFRLDWLVLILLKASKCVPQATTGRLSHTYGRNITNSTVPFEVCGLKVQGSWLFLACLNFIEPLSRSTYERTPVRGCRTQCIVS
jgi:hypothetical protein